MIMYETSEFAADWMKKIAGRDFKVFIFIRMYPNADTNKYPALRDRTYDATKMASGFELDGLHVFDRKGHQLRDAGWDVTGAQLAQDFRIFVGY